MRRCGIFATEPERRARRSRGIKVPNGDTNGLPQRATAKKIPHV